MDNSGELEENEVGQLLNTLGISINARDLRKLFPDGDVIVERKFDPERAEPAELRAVEQDHHVHRRQGGSGGMDAELGVLTQEVVATADRVGVDDDHVLAHRPEHVEQRDLRPQAIAIRVLVARQQEAAVGVDEIQDGLFQGGPAARPGLYGPQTRGSTTTRARAAPRGGSRPRPSAPHATG